MRIVLLSGGSGKRLWPLSNEIRSKVYLKLLPNEEGGRESMLQRVCRQLDAAGLLASTTILTHCSQVEITQHQVGEAIPIVAEPHKRGTFTAVALAACYLQEQQHAGPEETVCVIPVDLFVERGFFQLLSQLPEVLRRSGAELALVGTPPLYPSSQYGYIVPGLPEGEDYSAVTAFVEKPAEARAAELMDNNALWNCGIFAFPLAFMLSCLSSRGIPHTYEALLDHYPLLPEVSFDKEIVEKTSRPVVATYPDMWRDLGDWNVLPHYIGSPTLGAAAVAGDSFGTHVINELTIPIHVIGVPNIIVAASPDGILVANKQQSNTIKELLLGAASPMYGEKRWGTYRLVDRALAGTQPGEEATLTRKVEMLQGKHTSYHLHQAHKEVWTLLSGSGIFLLEGMAYPVRAGDVLQIPAGAKHAIQALTSLSYLEVQIGYVLDDADKVIFTREWPQLDA